MYFTREHNILVVDDEPDVLEVTKLALGPMKVFGVPLRLHLATSKAEALELLNGPLATQLPGFSLASVALIDVVMETDQAGLELCEYMRETLGNRYTEIWVRTGQPGIAPERAVIDRYDINGYISKPEVTQDKLYTVVKTGVREYILLSYAIFQDAFLQGMIAAGRSRAAIAYALQQMTAAAAVDPSGRPVEQLDIAVAILIEDQHISGPWEGGVGSAVVLRDKLIKLPGRPLGPYGDTLHTDGRECLMRIAPSETTTELHYVSRGTVPAPEFIVPLIHGHFRCIAGLWKLAS